MIFASYPGLPPMFNGGHQTRHVCHGCGTGLLVILLGGKWVACPVCDAPGFS